MPPAGSLSAEQLSFFDANGELASAIAPASSSLSLSPPAAGDEVMHELATWRGAFTEVIPTPKSKS